MDNLIAILTLGDKLPWVLIAIVGMFAWVFYQAQKADNGFDLKEMFVDPETGKVSITRFGQFVSLAVSSWGFIWLVLHDKLTEMYFMGYMTCWAGTMLASKAIGTLKKKDEPKKDE